MVYQSSKAKVSAALPLSVRALPPPIGTLVVATRRRVLAVPPMSGVTPGRPCPAAGKPDQTEQAVRLQLEAMACGLYELGVYPVDEGAKYNRERDADGVLALLPWLKARNANGYHVYIRPKPPTNLILIDDVTSYALKRLHRDGLVPAAVTQTSSGNYQAWIRVSASPITGDLETATAAELARRYGGDPDAAHRRQFGRLAGFTNRKPGRRLPNGWSPYVRFISGNRGVAPAAAELLEHVAGAAHEVRHAPATGEAFPRPGTAAPECLAEEYGRMMAERRVRYPDADLHRHDWAICCALAARYPDLGESMLVQAILDATPDIATRHSGETGSYARRTARKALLEVRGG